MSRAHTLPHSPVGRLASDHPGIVKFGRAGWFAKGVIYVVAGVLALLIAAKASAWSSAVTTPDEEASPTGALKTIAQISGGALLMWALAGGMLVYAAWRVVSALLPGGTDAKAWAVRIGYLISAVIYTTFALTAISLARSARANADGNAKVTSMSASVMEHAGGRFVIGVVGAITIAAGLYRLGKGVRGDVTDELDLSALSPQRRRWTERLGVVGEIGRALGIGLIGFFLLRAAVTYDAAQATGLDGALRRLAIETWGLVIVVAIGVGFAAYGLFCLATFTHRELQAP
jgi:Domain of Unknown Function (DUF1206)